MGVRVGLQIKLSDEELMLLNCGVEKTLESPLDCKEIQPVNPKGNQSWIFTVRTDAKAETPILGPPDAKNWLIWKDPDSGKYWRQEEMGMTEYNMVGWHHQFNGHEFEQAPGDRAGQGSLACCSPWGHKESGLRDWTTAMQDVNSRGNWAKEKGVYKSFLHYRLNRLWT